MERRCIRLAQADDHVLDIPDTRLSLQVSLRHCLCRRLTTAETFRIEPDRRTSLLCAGDCIAPIVVDSA